MWPPKTDCRFGIYIEKYFLKIKIAKKITTLNKRTFTGVDWESEIVFLVKSYFSGVNDWAFISLCFIYKRDWKHLIYNKYLDTLPQQSLIIHI